MVKTLDANQVQKIDRPYVRPIYLVHFLFDGLTLYFSDRCLPYNGHEYEDYLFDLSPIGNQIRNLGGMDNAQVTLRFKNDRIRDKATLIELFDDYPPEKRYVEIYKLYADPGETFGSDISTKIWKGEMGQPYEIYDPPTDFKIDCSLMLFGKNAGLPLNAINTEDFPSADPDDIGKYRNIVYGSLKKLTCPWTKAGWLSTLTADITSAATSIVASESDLCPATPFTAYIDNEEVRVTNNVKATGTLTVSRAYGGTTAVAHNKGAAIYEKRSDFEVEVAQHPVKAINNIYVKRNADKEWLRVLSGVTKNISIDGRATIVFSDRVKCEQKTNLAPATDTGTHPHAATSGMTGNQTKKCIPTGGTAQAIDGNEATYYGWSGSGGAQATFTEADLGTVVKQYCYVLTTSSGLSVYCGGVPIGVTTSGAGWKRFVRVGGSWNDVLSVSGPSSGNCYELYKEVEYTPTVTTTVNTHAADGVATSLLGNSVANMRIGDQVACDVDGYADDGSGTYTGTPNALIERPDHVRKHILISLLNFLAGDIGATFATVGAIYAGQIAGGYKFAFNLPDVATETMDLFEKMDIQSRSNTFESGGVFQLAFGLTSEPTSQITFDKNNIDGRFKFSKTEVVDIKNKLTGYYFRDYSKQGDLGYRYKKNNPKSDDTSIKKYGTLKEDIEFSCVGDLSVMVDDVLTWILIVKQQLKKIVEFEAFWDATILDHCDYFIVMSTFWSGRKYKTLRIEENESNGIISIKGIEFLAPFIKYGTGVKFGDGHKYGESE